MVVESCPVVVVVVVFVVVVMWVKNPLLVLHTANLYCITRG